MHSIQYVYSIRLNNPSQRISVDKKAENKENYRALGGAAGNDLLVMTTLWEGAACGRECECITCYQGSEMLLNCMNQSKLYENVYHRCVPVAREMLGEDLSREQPVLYMVEAYWREGRSTGPPSKEEARIITW